MVEEIYLNNPLVQAVSILLGIVVLLVGRKLFWLTVGVVGFVVGLSLVFTYLELQPLFLILAALVAGGLGALVAIVLQKVAVSIAGFLMGGYGLIWLAQFFNLGLARWEWLLFIVGAIAGLVLVASLFEIGLILLSTLVGTTMILQAITVSPTITAVLFVVLVALGVGVQLQGLNGGSDGAPRRRRQSPQR